MLFRSDDLIIGARGADPDGDYNAGESYVVFGGEYGVKGWTNAGASLDLETFTATNGFTIKGIDADDTSGYSVSNAGDLNKDGYDDLIIGANYATNPGGDSAAGESYVIFGGEYGIKGWTGAGGSLDLETFTATNGFTISGIDRGDYSGLPVSSAGDMNNDGYDDLIIGAKGADPGGADKAGESYVIFGGSSLKDMNLGSLGTNGFMLAGIDSHEASGGKISCAGDEIGRASCRERV